MSGRSARVGALSDKIQGLKFMQRATPSSSSSSTDARASAGPATGSARPSEAAAALARGLKRREAKNALVGFPEEETRGAQPAKRALETHVRKEELVPSNEEVVSTNDLDDGNDEHWVLPAASGGIHARQSHQTPSSIVVEPGWHAWLGQMTSASGADDAHDQRQESGVSARRSYGGWDDSSKRKRGNRSNTEDVGGDDDDDDIDIDNENGPETPQGSSGKKDRRKRQLPDDAPTPSTKRTSSDPGVDAGKFMKPGSGGKADAIISNARKQAKLPSKKDEDASSATNSMSISASSARKQRKSQQAAKSKKDK